MTIRRPLVVVAGVVQELPSGDSIASAGVSAADVPNASTGQDVILPSFQRIRHRNYTITGNLLIEGDLVIL